jgi:hypothetical protein
MKKKTISGLSQMQQKPQMDHRQSLLKRRKNSCEPAEKDSKQLK